MKSLCSAPAYFKYAQSVSSKYSKSTEQKGSRHYSRYVLWPPYLSMDLAMLWVSLFLNALTRPQNRMRGVAFCFMSAKPVYGTWRARLFFFFCLIQMAQRISCRLPCSVVMACAKYFISHDHKVCNKQTKPAHHTACYAKQGHTDNDSTAMMEEDPIFTIYLQVAMMENCGVKPWLYVFKQITGVILIQSGLDYKRPSLVWRDEMKGSIPSSG